MKHCSKEWPSLALISFASKELRKRTALFLRPKRIQAGFGYPVLMESVLQLKRCASIETDGSRTGQGLDYKAGDGKLDNYKKNFTIPATCGRSLSW